VRLDPAEHFPDRLAANLAEPKPAGTRGAIVASGAAYTCFEARPSKAVFVSRVDFAAPRPAQREALWHDYVHSESGIFPIHSNQAFVSHSA
jgi:hypothetical protein